MLFTTPEQVIILAIVLLAGWLLGYASAPSAKAWRRKVRAQSDSFTAYHGDAEDKLRAATQRATDLTAETEALRADHVEAERTIAALRAAAAAAPVKTVKVWAPVVRAPAPEVAAEPAASPVTTIEQIPAVAAPVEVPAAEAPLPVAAAVPAHHLAAELAPEQPTVAEATAHTEASAAEAADAPSVPSKGWFGSAQRDDLTRIDGIDGRLATRLFGVGIVRFADIVTLSGEDEGALEQRLALPAGSIARAHWRAQAAALRADQPADDGVLVTPVEAAPTV